MKTKLGSTALLEKPKKTVLPKTMKLGKRPARHDPRTLQLAKYTTAALQPAPASVDWSYLVSNWGMYMNDTLGDCTIAAAAHMIELWTADAGNPVVPNQQDILTAYEAVSGYNPATGQNADAGADCLTVMRYWQNVGIGADKTSAYAAIELGNFEQFSQAIALFGGCYIGIRLPMSAQGQPYWAVPPMGPVGPGAPGSWGGHAIPIVGYDPQGLTVVTWGTTLRMSWQFLQIYCDEAFVILDQDFLNGGTTSQGFDLQMLLSDINQL
jgi:hypothetical protein